ncbi:MAG: T9SS type A sorting domain-containing protein [Bacteroidota bacterium]
MKSISKTLVLLMLFVGNLVAQEALSGNITANTTLTSNKTYILKGIVRVMSGATLTIEPGTIIYGEAASWGSLIIKPGAKIMATGTVDKPIVFTSEFTKPGSTKAPNYGDWGGIIILGNAPVNVPGGKALIEGPGDEYGGTIVDDNSGVLKYIRIEYPGIAYSLNNEINGITFGGVGNKTLVEHIQVSYSGDDSFEWFGGTVNAKYLIAYRGWDDDFDTDFGYNGKLQFLLSVRDPQIADQSSSNGFESDNDASGSTNSPRTNPTYYNVTLIGPAAVKTSSYNSLFRRGMHLRRSSQNKIANALIMGWPDGVLIDGTNTVADMKSGTTAYIKNSIIAGSVSADFKSTDATFQTEMPAWFTANGGKTFATNAEVGLIDPFNLAKPNPMPKSNSPVFTGAATPPSDGFFDTSAKFIGAFGSTNWADRWSSLSFTGVSVEEKGSSSIPTKFELSQNYPNPFNPSTVINYKIQAASHVTLKVYDLLGREAATLVNEFQQPGNYNSQFSILNSQLSSGVYFYQLKAGSFTSTRKMNLLK